MELRALMQHAFRLYGKRNRVYLPSLRDRIDFLNLSIGDLQDVIRKDGNQALIARALARVVTRIFCVAGHFEELPFIEVMALKYPDLNCGYCGHSPCDCPPGQRPEASLQGKLAFEQLRWGLGEWSKHLDRLYGLKNRNRGIENIMNRLFKEISELMALSLHVKGATLEEAEREFALELSDALAWTIGVANFYGVDLERAYLERYGDGCRECGRSICNCTAFDLTPKKWFTAVARSGDSS